MLKGVTMGRVRTSDIKDTAKRLYDKFPDKFSGDFTENKKSIRELVDSTSKKFINRTSGYMVRVVKNKKRSKI